MKSMPLVGQEVAIKYLDNQARLDHVVKGVTQSGHIVVSPREGTQEFRFDQEGRGIGLSRRWQLVVDVDKASAESARAARLHTAIEAIRNVRVQIKYAGNSTQDLFDKINLLEVLLSDAKRSVAAVDGESARPLS